MTSNQDIICFCQDITLATVLKAIEQGHNTVESLIEATDAGIACGTCIEALESILEEQ